MSNLKCVGMHTKGPCLNPVTRIDCKGYVYCERCGLIRKASGVSCRKLKPAEVRTLEAGQPISYKPKPKSTLLEACTDCTSEVACLDCRVVYGEQIARDEAFWKVACEVLSRRN